MGALKVLPLCAGENLARASKVIAAWLMPNDFAADGADPIGVVSRPRRFG